MNVGVSLSKQLALKAIGSAWYLDGGSGLARENLGKGRPPLHFGPTYPDRESLERECGKEIGCEPLPERIRIPKHTPIAISSGPRLQNASTYAWLVLLDDVLGKGLRVERRRIASVEYMPAPIGVSDIADWVASAAVLDGSPVYRIRIGHDPEGNPVASGYPERQTAWGWSEAPDTAAFLSLGCAEAYADEIAAALRCAADWRRTAA